MKADLCLALQAIMKCTFAVSPYPIIIAAEIRCSLPQQDVMANIMLEIFWDTLVCAPIDG
jgi:phosphatidylinositol phospholipase C delta